MPACPRSSSRTPVLLCLRAGPHKPSTGGEPQKQSAHPLPLGRADRFACLRAAAPHASLPESARVCPSAAGRAVIAWHRLCWIRSESFASLNPNAARESK